MRVRVRVQRRDSAEFVCGARGGEDGSGEAGGGVEGTDHCGEDSNYQIISEIRPQGSQIYLPTSEG
jgi:hypothetical protein